MRVGKPNSLLFLMILVGALAGTASAQQSADQTQPRVGDSTTVGTVTTVSQAIDRILARENDEVATIRRYNPIIETNRNLYPGHEAR